MYVGLLNHTRLCHSAARNIPRCPQKYPLTWIAVGRLAALLAIITPRPTPLCPDFEGSQKQYNGNMMWHMCYKWIAEFIRYQKCVEKCSSEFHRAIASFFFPPNSPKHRYSSSTIINGNFSHLRTWNKQMFAIFCWKERQTVSLEYIDRQTRCRSVSFWWTDTCIVAALTAAGSSTLKCAHPHP